MILRSVIKHVKDQNWTAVGLDFLIVVTGVFIGIQVSNWNDARVEQRELATSLENLAQEISNKAWHRTDQIEWMERVVAGLGLMLDALDGQELSPEQWDQAHFSLARVASVPPDPGRYETLYELQSTGMLRKVPSRELRAALGEMLSLDKLAQPFYENSLRSLSAPDFDPEIVRYGLEGQDPSSAGRGALRVESVDLARATSDPLFHRRIIQGHSTFMERIRINRMVRSIDCDILARLAAEGHKPSGHWLMENLERFSGKTDNKSLPPSCESTP